jgi:hypothetical protein
MSLDQGPPPSGGGEGGVRGRLVIALGALLLFGAIVAVVLLLAGGSPERSAAAAAAECLDAWNEDEAALAFSRHNQISHNYREAEVAYLNMREASVSSDSEAGQCVVIFARTELDPEAIAAGQVLRGDIWVPLNQVLDLNTVARLQSEAFDGANAEPTQTGELVALGA